MTVNWDAIVGIAFFLGGTSLACGMRVAGGIAMLIGAIYIARSFASARETDGA